MRKYNPDKKPNSTKWLALDEDQRILLIERFHEQHGEYGESLKTHSVIHAVVEAQLAEETKPVEDALLRLRKSGLSRHDSIHAIGSVLAEYIWEVLENDEAGDINEEYFARLSQLTTESWHAHYENDA